jgi:putative membrane protein
MALKDYKPPFTFTGKIHGITVDVSGDLIKDDERALKAILARHCGTGLPFRMTEEQPLSTNDLALKRTVMATDRTLMAWTRTSLALISFGFTIYKILHYAREEGDAARIVDHGPRYLGLSMVGLGVVFLSAASIQYWLEMRKLQGSRWTSILKLPLLMALLLALLGLGAMSNIAFRIGPF